MSNSLVLLQWNCRSIRDKHHELMALIATYNPHIIALCETWLHSDFSLSIRGYSICRKDRVDGYGGVLLACRNDLISSSIAINTNFECVGCSVSLTSRLQMNIVSVYFPPNLQISSQNLELMLNCIPEPRFILGDFNAHSQQWGCAFDDQRANILSSVFDDNNLITLNTGEHTRVVCPPRLSSAIDLSLCSAQLGFDCSWRVCDDLYSSDHLPIIIEFNTSVPHITTCRPVNLIKNIIWSEYQQIISSDTFFEENPTRQHYDSLVYNLISAARNAQSKPLVVNHSGISHKPKPWWNAEIASLYTRRKDSFKLFKRRGGQVNFLSYKQIDAELRRLIKQRKKDSYRKYVSTLSPNTSLRQLYLMAKRYRGCFRPHALSSISWLQDFIDKLAPPFVMNEFVPYQHGDSSDSAFLSSPISLNEFNSALLSCNNSSPGLDLIHFDLLKHLPECGKLFVIKMFNIFMCTEQLPDAWYDCKVIAIQKPGKNPDVHTSYRPICLLSCVRKLFEKILHSRLDFWIESNHLNSVTQFGFRKGFGTQDCLALFATDLETNYAKKNTCLAVFLDISSAYDDVQIPILCDILSQLNLPRIFIKMIYLLFCKRNLLFYVNGSEIDRRIGFKGLAQGSTLSPLLFNIYTIQIEQCLNNEIRMIQYADDVLIYMSSQNNIDLLTKMQDMLNTLHHNYQSLGLDISPNKSECVVFTKKRMVPDFPLLLANHPLKISKSFKYLGVVFDSKSTWNLHVKYISGKCKKRINFLRTIAGVRWGAHPIILLSLYKTTIRSILEYGAFAFMNLARTHKIRLDRLQWRSLRIAMGLMTSTHTGTLEVQAGILPLDLRWKELSLKMRIKSFASPSSLLRDSVKAALIANPNHVKHSIFAIVHQLSIQPPILFSCYSQPWPSIHFV